MVEPLNSFCCGCPLEVGVKITLVMHLLSCLFYMMTCLLNVVLDEPTLGHRVSFEIQAFNAGFALASLPFVGSGFSGIMYDIEIHLRIYLYWLLMTCTMDFALYAVVLSKNSCTTMPTFLDDFGSAFTCGFMRMAGLFFLCLFLLAMGYCCFTVWSKCEELTLAGTERSFTDLQKRQVYDTKAMVFQYRGGLFGTGPALLQSVRPIVYGSLSTDAYGGSATIFGSRTNPLLNRHDNPFMGPDKGIHDHPSH